MLRTKSYGIYETTQILPLPIQDIMPNPAQPRKQFDSDSLRELAASITRYGILQPLTVRRLGRSYELVSGERRLRAARLAGLQKVPCIILQVDPADSSALALVENLHRQDLDFLEEALGLQQLIEVSQATYDRMK